MPLFNNMYEASYKNHKDASKVWRENNFRNFKQQTKFWMDDVTFKKKAGGESDNSGDWPEVRTK